MRVECSAVQEESGAARPRSVECVTLDTRSFRTQAEALVSWYERMPGVFRHVFRTDCEQQAPDAEHAGDSCTSYNAYNVDDNHNVVHPIAGVLVSRLCLEAAA